MSKIQFDVSVANGVAIDVANDVHIYFWFSGSRIPKVFYRVIY